jgi:hypothetical protein
VELVAWQARRILITSELLGIPPAAVQPFDIGFCNRWYGKPRWPGDCAEDAPRPEIQA